MRTPINEDIRRPFDLLLRIHAGKQSTFPCLTRVGYMQLILDYIVIHTKIAVTMPH